MKKIIQYFGLKVSKNSLKHLLIFIFLFSSISYAQVTPVRTIDVIDDVACGKLIEVELGLTGVGNEPTPLEVILVVDVSGSMDGQRIDDATTAASTFVTDFLTDPNRHSDSKIGVVKFNDSASLVQGLTNNINDFSGDFWDYGSYWSWFPLGFNYDNFYPDGATNMEDGIEKAVAAFSSSTDCALTRTIIFLSDGEATVDNSGSNADPSTRAIQEAISAQAIANFYTIGFATNSTATNTLTEMQNSGFYAGANATDLNNIYTTIYNQLSWVAKAPASGVFNKEIIDDGFELVNSSISVTKGSFVINNDGDIEWDIDFIQEGESISLTYQLISNGICGEQTLISSSEINYLDTSCNFIPLNPLPVKWDIDCSDDQIVAICQGDTVGEFSSDIECPDAGETTNHALENYAGYGTNSGSGDSWSNPTNIYADDGQTASLAYQSGDSKYLDATNFDFTSIPNNATINGITVVINRWASSSDGTNGVKDTEVRLLKYGSTVGNDKKKSSVWGTDSSGLVTYGGATDLWGESWNVSDIKDNNFGARLEVDINGSRSAHVDYIKIKVDYSIVTVAGALEWFTVETGGVSIYTGSDFSPIDDAGLNTNIPGTYNYYAGCSNIPGCRKLYQFVVNPLPTPVDASFTICSDETSIDLTAKDVIVLDGEVGTVTWYDGDPTGSGTLINPATAVNLNNITDLFAEVTLDTGSCKASVDITVTVNNTPNAPGFNITQPTCTVSTGSVELTGLPSGTWTINPGNITGNGATYIINNLVANTYNYTVTNANGCTSQATSSIVINSQPATASTPIITSVLQPACNGENGSFTISNYNASYTYTFSPNTGVTNTNGVVTAPDGTYTVTASIGVCVSDPSAEIVILEPVAITASASKDNDVSCFGGNDGTATASAVGGTTDYTYSWNTSPVQNTAIATGLTQGTYTVIVTDANGCEDTAEVTIGQPELLTVSLNGTPSNVTCYGEGNGNISINVSGGTIGNGYSYEWTKDGQYFSSDEDIMGLDIGVYQVVVYDGNECSATLNSPVTITQPDQINVNAGSSKTITCSNDTVVLNGSSNSKNVTYSWTTQNGIIESGANTLTPTVSESGTYTLTITNNETGCSNSDTVVVGKDIAKPNAIILTETTVLTCDTTSIELDGSTSTSNATYIWNTGERTKKITVTEPGNYWLEVSYERNGCAKYAFITIEEDIEKPLVTITGNDELTCTTTSITLDASSSTVQGTASYLWSTGATTATIAVTESGDYDVTVTDSDNGCSTTSGVFTVIQDITEVVATITGGSELNCTTTSITLDASSSTVQGTASYLWSTGATTATIAVTEPGDYNVMVTDSDNGCSTTSGVFIVAQDIIDVVATITGDFSELTCSIGSITLDASSSTVQGDASYVWYNDGELIEGEMNSTLIVSEVGNYTVLVTDADNGCSTLSDAFIVTEDGTLVVATIIGDSELNCTTTSITLDASSSTVQGAATYLWNTGATSATIEVTESGDYSVTVTDSDNGCSTLSELFTVTEDVTPVVALISGSNEINCLGSIVLDASSSTVQGTASYLWNTGATTATIDVTEAGDYSVTVTDSDNGCFTESDLFTVTVVDTGVTVVANICDDLIDINYGETFSIDLNEYLGVEENSNGVWVSVGNETVFGSNFDLIKDNTGRTYEFEYTDENGCVSILAIQTCAVLPCSTDELTISKVVTPNNDSFNDTFELGGLEGCGFNFHVQVFNRWGKMVFESENYLNNWSGVSNTGGSTIGSSTSLSAGTYYYIVRVLDSGFDPVTGYIYLGTR